MLSRRRITGTELRKRSTLFLHSRDNKFWSAITVDVHYTPQSLRSVYVLISAAELARNAVPATNVLINHYCAPTRDVFGREMFLEFLIVDSMYIEGRGLAIGHP